MNLRSASVTAVAVLLVLAAVPVADLALLPPADAQTVGPPSPAPDAPPGATSDVPEDGPARVTLAAIDPVVGPGSVIVPPAAPSPPVEEDEDLPPGGAADPPLPGSTNGPTTGPVPSSVTGAGWSILVEHTGTSAWETLEVVADLHGALGSRSALRAALAGGVVPAAVQRISVDGPTGPIAPGDVVRIDGTVPLASPALAGSDSAVHPLRLRVIADGRVVGGIDTAVVRLGAAPTTTLATNLVWSLSAPPLRDPAGDPAGALDPLTVDGGRFDTLLAALAPLVEQDATDPRLRDLARGIALVAPAHLLEDLARRSAEVPATSVEDAVGDVAPPSAPDEDVDEAALRAAVLLRRIRSTALALPSDPVASPYGDADLSRLIASGPALQPIAARSVLEGERRLAALLGRAAGTSVLLDAPVAPRTLDLLPDAVVLLPYAAIDAPDLALDVPLDDPVRALRSPTGRTITALVADPYLTEALGGSTRELPADPLLAAHGVLVRTAMVHLEAPGRQGRGLLLLPPAGFDPDPRYAAELITRLAHAPWLTPSAPDVVVASAQGARAPARLAAVRSEPLPGRLVSALAATARDLELLVGAADMPAAATPGDGGTEPEEAADAEPVIPVGRRTLAEAGDELMRATSTGPSRCSTVSVPVSPARSAWSRSSWPT